MGFWNSTVPSFVVGRMRASKFQTLADIATATTSAWSTWIPVVGNLTIGSGTQIAKYRQLGKSYDFLWVFVYGVGSAVGTAPTFTLPAAPSTDWVVTTNAVFPMNCYLVDAGTGEGPGATRLSGSTVSLFSRSSFTAIANITATAPFTWTTGDGMVVSGTFYTA